MKLTFTFLFTLMISFAAVSQTTARIGDQPVLTPAPEVITLKESEFNFGKIPQGKPVSHVFWFTNNGNSPLVLDNVVASCGCTTPEWSKEPVSPKGTQKITVGYNAANEGAFTKFITITYNGNQTKQVIIKGEVWKTPTTSAPENSGLNSLKN